LLLSGALSAYPRQLDVIMPVLLFWIGFLAANTQRLSFKFQPEDDDYMDHARLTKTGVYTKDTI
jgi:hypothetical protein